MKYLTYCIGIAFSFLFTGPTSVFAQSTAFTYQGRLIDNGVRANGSYDLSFALYDAASNGSLVGTAITNSAVAVSNGLFTTSLDFGAGVLTNGSRWLEISERTNGSGNFAVLTPRQVLTAAPYAVAAGTLTGSLPASQLSGTIPLTQLSGAVLTNGATSVNLSGAFSGDGAGITNLNLMTADSSGTIGRLTNYLTTFTLASSPNVGAGPNSIATVDVNGDGKVDLISANTSGNTLTVLTNTGTGGFTTAGTYGVGDYPESVTAADVNGDGKMDLICANSGSIYGAGSLTVLTNDGGGGFMTANTYNLGGNPRSVAAADVNGDGKVDLICANNGRGTLTVLTNDGSGGFMTSGTYSVGNYLDGLVFVATADINGDGKVDLISVNAGNNLLTVLTNDGTGGFVTSGTYGLGLQPVSVAVADINGDHKPDLICAIEQWSSLMVLTNDGSGGFVMAGNYDTGGGGYPFSVAAADMNGDGHVDLISACVGGNTLTVLTNDNSGGFTLAGTYPVANYPYFVTTADVNGDGRLDLIGADYGDNTLVVLTNQTTVTYTPTVVGNGAGLTGFTAAQIPNLDASKITDGTIDAARLPSNLITNLQTDVTLAGTFNGDGSGLINMNAANLIGDGTLPVSVLPAAVVTNTQTGVNLSGVLNGVLNGNADTATLATNVVAGINITNAFITNSTFAGDGAGLTNLNAAKLAGVVPTASLTAVPAASLTGSGTLPVSVLPAAVVTNNETGITLSGTFTGNGGGLTNLNATQLTGVVPGAALTSVPAASLTGSGTLPASVLPATVVLNNASGVTLSGTFNGNLTGKATSAAAALLATNVVSGISITNAFITNSVFAGNGSGLTNVNAISLGGSQATLTANGVLLNTNLNLNGLAIYLRSPGDANHGLGYASSATNFTGAPDGPILWGFGGGALGSTDGGSKLGLVWTKNGVGIGTNSPQTTLDVGGPAHVSSTLTVDGSLQVGANYATVGAENVRVIRGIINGNGDTVGGSGFTVATNATTGRYAITFTTAFNAAPTITATSGGLPPAIATVIPVSNSQVILYFYSLEGAQVNPGSFNFIAVGP